MSGPQPVPFTVKAIRHELDTRTASAKSGCRFWLGPIGKGGMARLWLGGEHIIVRRAAWFVHYGEWPSRAVKLTCGNKLCCAVEHMTLRKLGPQNLRGYDAKRKVVVWNPEADEELIAAIAATPPRKNGERNWQAVRRRVEPALPWLVGKSKDVANNALQGRFRILLAELEMTTDQVCRLASLREALVRKRLDPPKSAPSVQLTYTQLGLEPGAAFRDP